MDFHFELQNDQGGRGTHAYRLRIDGEKMLISGSELDLAVDKKDDYCFLPFFRNNLPNIDPTLAGYRDTWVVGTRAMSSHYMVFEMESKGPEKSQILGIGPRNPEDNIGMAPIEPNSFT